MTHYAKNGAAINDIDGEPPRFARSLAELAGPPVLHVEPSGVRTLLQNFQKRQADRLAGEQYQREQIESANSGSEDEPAEDMG